MSILQRARHAEATAVIPLPGPPTIWGLHLLVCYLLQSATTVVGITWMRIEIAIATAVALAGIAACAFVAHAQRAGDGEHGGPSDLPDFVRTLGLATCLLFALGVIFTLVPALVLDRF